eukprot:NODE_636_length_5161_cov_0.504544.p3 type:complete len:360 gc:universal NODE_636_length_5161_cov_0.504544:261-1340(+)
MQNIILYIFETMLSFKWLKDRHRPLVEKYHEMIDAKVNQREHNPYLVSDDLIEDLLTIEALKKYTQLEINALQYHFNISLSMVSENLRYNYPSPTHSVALYCLCCRLLQELLTKPDEKQYSMYFAAIGTILELVQASIENQDFGFFSKTKEFDLVYLFKNLLDKKVHLKNGLIWKGQWVKKVDNLLPPMEPQIWSVLYLVVLNGEFNHLTKQRAKVLQQLNDYFEGNDGKLLIAQIPCLEKLWKRTATIALEPTVEEIKICEIDYLYERLQEPAYFQVIWKQNFKNWDDIELYLDSNKADNYVEYLGESFDLDLMEKCANTCNYCHEIASQKCGKCKRVLYCGRDCQKKDWASHKSQCK